MDYERPVVSYVVPVLVIFAALTIGFLAGIAIMVM